MLYDIRKLGFESFDNLFVQRAAMLAQQCAVSSILHQGVLEEVVCVWRNALTEQQARTDERLQGIFKIYLTFAGHRLDERMREFAADRRSNLRELFRSSKTVETRHQRSVKCCGNFEFWRWDRSRCSSRVFLVLRFQYCLGHLLDEQWNAVGPIDQVLTDIRRKKFVAYNSVDDGVDVAPSESIDGDGGHVRKSNPGRLEFRPECNNEQHTKRFDPIHDAANQL